MRAFPEAFALFLPPLPHPHPQPASSRCLVLLGLVAVATLLVLAASLAPPVAYALPPLALGVLLGASATLAFHLRALIPSVATSHSPAGTSCREPQPSGPSPRHHPPYETIVQLSLDIVSVVDAEGFILYESPALETVLGWKPDELVGHSGFEFVHAEDVAQLVAVLSEAVGSAGATARVDFRFRHKDGTWRNLEAVARNLLFDPAVNGIVIHSRDVTAQRAAASVSRQRERLFFELFDEAPVGVALIGDDGRFAHVNRRLCAMLGFSKSELLQRHFADLVVDEERPDTLATWEQLRSGTLATSRKEKQYRHKDGHVVWVDRTLATKRESSDDRWHVIAIVEDISERRAAATALEEQETLLRAMRARLEQLVRSNPAVLYSLHPGPHPKVAFISENVADQLGYNPAQFAADPTLWSRMVHPDDATRVMLGAQALSRTGRLSAEYRVRRADGSFRWVRDDGRLVRDKDGQPREIVGCLVDITERRAMEERLRLQAAALEAADNGVVITDTNGTIQWVNSAFTRLTGYSADEAIGQNPRILRSDHHTPEFYESLWTTILRGDVWHGELINRRKDGSDYIEETTITPVSDASGVVRNFVAIKQDVSQRKRDEEELRRAVEASDTATKAKSRFLANMSHEIRTPMNAVIGMTGLLLDTPLDSEQREFVETIRLSGESLLALINDILDFSKIESGKLELEQHPFSLSDCIEEAIDLVAPQAAKKGLELAYTLAAGVPNHVIGDVTRIRQILVNLLGNGVKFTKHGSVTISVATRPMGATGPGRGQAFMFHLSVRDTGIGIPPDRMDRLFRSFSQVDASTTRTYGGSGLGLAISKRLASAMGGTMWAESQPGSGSTFHVTLRAESVPDCPPPAWTQRHARFSGKKLLLVEDNPDSLRTLAGLARTWGFEVHEAASAATATELLRWNTAFDVAIIDDSLPDADGLTLVRRLKEYPAGRPIPVVLLAPHPERRRELVQRAQETPALAHLAKPLKPAFVLEAVLHLCGDVTPAAPAPPRARHDLPEPDPAGPPLRILLAEDNPINQRVALRMLEKLGYRADVACNGREAIEALQRQPYDVVFLDVQMPEMDGLQAAEQICLIWPRPLRPRLIAMTANAMESDRKLCLDSGMDDYLAKPVRLEQLRALLDTCLPLPTAPDLLFN